MFLDEKIQAQVREMLAPMQTPVELVVFTTSGLELPGQEVGLQDETLGLPKEVVALDPNLSLEQRSIHSDPEAQALGLSYPKDRLVYIHCNTQNRSAVAVRYLMGKGYQNLNLVTGGIQAWIARGYPAR